MKADRCERLLVVEEALKNRTGHWYEYNKAVVLGSRRAGVETTLLAHRDVDPELTRELGAKPFFPVTCWDGGYFHPSPLRRYAGIGKHNASIYRMLNRFIAAEGPFDCAFAPTVTIFHLFAWLWLARRHLHRGSLKRIVLLTRNSAAAAVDSNGVATFRRSTQILGWVLKRLAAVDGVCLCTDSTRLADEYRQLAGVEMATFPHPTEIPASARLPKARTDDTVVFACLGPARWEKGTDLVIEAARLLSERDLPRPARIQIQPHLPIVTPDGSSFDPADSGFRAPTVELEILGSNLSSEAYAALLRESDCVVMPYRRQSYYARISGVAVEAMLYGKPVIYTKNTWMSDAIQRFGAGVGFEDESAQSLADAMERTIRERDRLATEAFEKRTAAESYYSIENFLASLYGHPGPEKTDAPKNTDPAEARPVPE